MPRNVLRQFTGGISNEIDPQNLRDDQGEEALDINLKGFALEPGDGLEELTDAGHYHYRGEWIRDSEAVSFEESGIGVVKTYNNKRPQFEEIINDEVNVSRDLGPSLPPDSIVTGSVVSECSRGLRPAEGSHLLKLDSDKFGAVDTGTASNTPPYSDAPSLEEHRADSNTDDKKIYYYSDQPYWIDDSDSANWKVVTRQPGGSPGEWTTNLIETASPLTKHSGGYLFKENYFICWDGQYIETVELSSSSMTVNTFDTVDATQGGDAGSPFNQTTDATGKSITSLDVCNGVITFAQEIQTKDPEALSAYTDSANERWILPLAHDAILLLLRDGNKTVNWVGSVISEGTGAYNAGSDEVEIYAKSGSSPPAKVSGGYASWQTPKWWAQGQFDDVRLGKHQNDRYVDTGIKWCAVIHKANEWAMVKYVGSNKPDILMFGKKGVYPKDSDIKNISVTGNMNPKKVISLGAGDNRNGFPSNSHPRTTYYTVTPTITLSIPKYGVTRKYVNNTLPAQGWVYWTQDLYNKWTKTHNYDYLSQRPGFSYHFYTYTGKKNITFGEWKWHHTLSYPWWDHMTIDKKTTWTLYHNNGSAHPDYLQREANKRLKSNSTSNTIGSTGYSKIVLPTIQRLCSYSPNGSITLQTNFPKSRLWTKAVINASEKSIAFAEASDKAFTVGDFIKVQARASHLHRTLSWNQAFRRGGDGIQIKPQGGTQYARHGASTNLSEDYFLAKITRIDNSATKIYFDRVDNRPVVDESCYPIINSIDPFADETTHLFVHPDYHHRRGKLDGPQREVIQTDLFGHVLTANRPAEDPDNQTIEVRPNSGAVTTNSDFKHSIKWKDQDVRAVTTTSGAQPRILYKKSGKLYSQNGSDSDVAPSSRVFTNAGVYHLTSDYLSVVDNDKITVYDPFYNVKYVMAKPEISTGLGLTGLVEDVLHVIASSVVFVFVKIRPDAEATAKWRLVKTGTTKSETSILSYNFNKPLHFDGLKAWGIYRGASTEKFDIHTSVPFFESDLKNSWVNHSSSSNNVSAWGQVTKTREAKGDNSGTPRYLSVEWKFDSGVSGDPTIGLNHESNKMLGDQNDFTWYILDAPTTLQSGGVGTQITSPKLEIKFKSKVYRDIVFFKTSETVVPSTGQTGANNRVSFTNYQESGQNFYVLNDNAIVLKGGADAKEKGYILGNADAANNAFDASKVGISSFLVGAPNMFNPYGPNIDFYYRASFIDKWGNESAPSVASAEGIQPLDSADDCIQINFDENFFHFDNKYIETIRVYRYGGDSSEWMFLRDIDMPDLTGFPLSLSGISGTFARVSTLSKFYSLKTYQDITKLRGFTNSNFDLTATPSDMDGSWNIIQLSESASPTVAYTTTLSAEINETATTIALTSTTNPSAWPTAGVVKIEEEYISYTGISGTSLTGCTRAQNDSSASRHESGKTVDVVEWLLEIQHRNQDTSTLSVTIDPPYSASTGAITIYVEDASLFQTASGGSPKKLLIGNEIYEYTGRDITSSPNKFTGCTTNSAGSLPTIHEAGVTVFSYEESYSNTAVTNMSIEINSFGYRDKARAPVTSLHYLQNDNYPPVGLKYNEEKKNFFEPESTEDYYRYITAVGSMYFGALDANLQFSRYGTPEYWPLDAVVTLDSEVRAIMEHAGEGLVWTTNSLYRVRGTDPKAMIAFRVPDAHGIKAGDEHTVAEFGGGVLWLTANDGIAYYQAGKVQYLTRDKHIVTDLVKPQACVADGVYWLFQKPGSGKGIRLEITGGDLRLCQTSIEAHYAHYSKAVGKAIVVTEDDQLGDSAFKVEEVGSTKATNIVWKSKKIDAGEPALAKALGSLAVVYEVLESKSSETNTDGIRGQALAAQLLGMSPDDLDAGDLVQAGGDDEVDMYDVFVNYGNAEQYFEIDIGGGNLSETERKKLVMPLNFDTSSIKAGDKIWNEMLADNTKVSSVTTAVVNSVTYPAILLDKEPLRSGTGTVHWGNLPVIDVFINNDTNAARSFTLPPSDTVEPLTADLYLNDLRRFRTISVKIEGNVRIQTLAIRHYPLQQYQAQTLTHSADVFYKGDIDFRVMLDGELIYRKELNNSDGEFKEERIYLPASAYGQRIHYMNESMSGTIESVTFNGNMAA